MRLFFGLKPDPNKCLAIEGWREHTLPPLRRPVPTHNLHLTLVFLGEVRERQLEPLLEEVDRIHSPPIHLEFDELGYFPKPQVLWIGPGVVPSPLTDLVKALNSICRRQGLQIEKRKFKAHLTIARRCEIAPPASALPPDFKLDFDSFALFESTNTRNGVLYRSIAEWPLA